MADSLYLSLWFPDFGVPEMFAYALAVMRQFPFSRRLPGITHLAVHPISWNEATVLEQQFRPGVVPVEAMAMAAGLIHEDYACIFEANWDLWSPQNDLGEWSLQPSLVRFILRGEEFDEVESKTQGEVQVDFGLDTPFLHEELELTGELESRVRVNVQLLVEFINNVKKNSGASARLLWSESDESLAQKLVSRLQKVQ